MFALRALAGMSAMLMLTAGLALGDGTGPRGGHALGPDLAALARPLPVAAPTRGGHAFGQDLAALQIPIVSSRAARGGHAHGQDLAALRTSPWPSAPARGGHAFGADLAALEKPLDCAAPGASCPTAEAVLTPTDLAPRN